MNLLFLTGWVLFQASIFTLGFFMQKTNPGLATLNRLGYSVYISRGAGLCLAILPSLLLFPMCRHSVTFLREKIPVIKNVLPDFSVYFHKVCSYTLLFWASVHATCHYINFIGVENILEINKAVNLHFKMIGGVTGHIMGISLFFIFVTSFKKIKSNYYEVFWYFHHFFVLFFLAFIIHGSGCFVKTDNGNCVPYYSAFINAPVIFLFLIERVTRQFKKEIKLTDVTFSGEILKIKFPKNTNYSPGQYILLNCPDVSYLQWHPFTISSSPSEEFIEVSIRCLGNWTEKFRNVLLEKISNNESLPNIKIDGSFGSPIDTISNYNAAILVATGIGITPFISMLKHVIKTNGQESKEDNVKKIDLIWVNRDSRYFEWFNEEIKFFWENSSSLRINFHIYLTENPKNTDVIKSIVYGDNVYLNNVYKTDIPINYGRPDLNKFFKNYIKTNNDLRIGCFVCGSKSIEVNVKKMCEFYSNKDLKFIFKAEKFS